MGEPTLKSVRVELMVSMAEAKHMIMNALARLTTSEAAACLASYMPQKNSAQQLEIADCIVSACDQEARDQIGETYFRMEADEE
jgi:hypothetical protein